MIVIKEELSLAELLSHVEGAAAYQWCIVELEGMGYQQPLWGFEDKVNATTTGLTVCFQQLQILSANVRQLIWLTLIGDKGAIEPVAPYTEAYEAYLKARYAFHITFVDGAYWEIEGKEAYKLQHLCLKV